MSLPESYTLKPGSIADYFDAIVNAQPPERFSTRFLEGLGFKSTNDRLIIGVLKDLSFLDSDGKPQPRYFDYLDRSQSARVLADAVREAYSDLFAVRTTANEFSQEEVRDKLRTLYAGKKSDQIISRIAATFSALCEIADFTALPKPEKEDHPATEDPHRPIDVPKKATDDEPVKSIPGVRLRTLQYHINIILPESRDQAVYDAIFKALRDHLG